MLALVVERFLTLRRKRVLPPGLLEDAASVVRQRRITPDVLTALEHNSPLGTILAAAIRHHMMHPDSSKEEAHAVVEAAGRRVAHSLEKYLNALGTIASVSPLMGLLGTVIGMIEIFGLQDGTSSNPQQLAHGISIALYNTAFGLIVAIPALIAWRIYRRQVDDYVMELEAQATQFLEGSQTSRRTEPPRHRRDGKSA